MRARSDGASSLEDSEDPVEGGIGQLLPTRRDRPDDLVDELLRRLHLPAKEPALEGGLLREALRFDEPRQHGEHLDPAAAELPRDRARERELRVLRRGVRARRRKRDGAGDGDDVRDVCLRRRRLEARQERAQGPDASEVVRVDHSLDRLGVGAEEVAPAGNAGVVDEQVELWVALEHRRRDAVDVFAARDVADLVLGSQLLRELPQPVLAACEQHEAPPVACEPARQRGADPARGAGDDG